MNEDGWGMKIAKIIVYGWILVIGLSLVERSGPHTLKGMYVPTGGITKADADVDDEIVSAVNRQMLALPEGLVEIFEKEGWQVVVVQPGTLERQENKHYPESGFVSGRCAIQEKTIYLHQSEYGAKAVLHEFGHFVHYLAGDALKDMEFVEAYDREKDAFCKRFDSGGYAKTNITEYFASVFQETLLNRAACFRVAPKSTVYVEKITKQIIKEKKE